MPKGKRPVVHLFDGHVYIFRAYFSLPEMQGEDGTPCNAAYGFANTLIGYLTFENPTHVAVTFDHSLESFRNEIDPEYKADRPEAPEDLEPQFDLCADVAQALGISVFEQEGFEADDLLATLARQLVKRGADVVIVTSDKDLSQVVREDGRVSIYDLARGRTFDADAVREKFGVSPHQIPDYLGLVGDAVDNIPGVPGIGAKSAAALLQHFGALDAIPGDFEDWNGFEIRGVKRVAKQLFEHREQAERCRELATVCDTVPDLAAKLGDLRYRGADGDRFGELSSRLGWKGIASRVPEWRGGLPGWLA